MKCYECKKPCETVWMFGVAAETEKYKDREYCLECFTPLSNKLLPQPEQQSQAPDTQEIANSA